MNITRRSFLSLSGAFALAPYLPKANARWWKGNFHMHTLRSDGQSFPTEAAALYKRAGYHFICFTDHNASQEDGGRWFRLATKHPRLTPQRLERFVSAFPQLKPEERTDPDGGKSYRLPPLEETVKLVSEPGKFLIMGGVELTTRTKQSESLHCNAINVHGPAPKYPQPDDQYAALDWCLNEYSRLRNPNSIFTLNHPLWKCHDAPVELLLAHPEIRFFEVANITGGVLKFKAPPEAGDCDTIWDVANAFRAIRNTPLLFGTDTDDMHCYDEFYDTKVTVRGHSYVLAETLDSSSIITSVNRGDFYASTGVELQSLRFDTSTKTLTLSVKPEPGFKYRIEFIGTRKGFPEKPIGKVTWTVDETLPEWAKNYSRERSVTKYSEKSAKHSPPKTPPAQAIKCPRKTSTYEHASPQYTQTPPRKTVPFAPGHSQSQTIFSPTLLRKPCKTHRDTLRKRSTTHLQTAQNAHFLPKTGPFLRT